MKARQENKTGKGGGGLGSPGDLILNQLVRREGGSGWGTHVNPWLIHVNVRQNPLQLKKKKKEKKHVKKENDEFLATFHLYFPLDPFTFKILLN